MLLIPKSQSENDPYGFETIWVFKTAGCGEIATTKCPPQALNK